MKTFYDRENKFFSITRDGNEKFIRNLIFRYEKEQKLLVNWRNKSLKSITIFIYAIIGSFVVETYFNAETFLPLSFSRDSCLIGFEQSY